MLHRATFKKCLPFLAAVIFAQPAFSQKLTSVRYASLAQSFPGRRYEISISPARTQTVYLSAEGPKTARKKTRRSDWRWIRGCVKKNRLFDFMGPAPAGSAWDTLELKAGAVSKTIFFDRSDIPSRLKATVSRIKSIQGKLQGATAENNTGTMPALKDEAATVKNFVCSRGCYQWVLIWEKGGKKIFLYDEKLPGEFKRDGLKTIVSGSFSGGTTEIRKPAPNDVPIRDFDALNFRVTAIKRAG